MTSNVNETFASFLKNWIPPVIEEEPKPKPEPIKVGDILVAQWGYEANNVNFFKVFKRTKSFLEIAELNVINGSRDTGIYDSVFVTPADTWRNYSLWADRTSYNFSERNDGQPIKFRKKIKTRSDGREFIELANYANAPRAYLWNGKPCVDYNHH